MNKWHETKTGTHQGLIIDDTTGENIAVTYDKKMPVLSHQPLNC